jgi:hypothetical protein
MKRLLIILLSLAWAPQVSAQTFAIQGVRIHTISAAGEIASGTVVVTNGRIAAVGPAVSIPPGARVIDGAGMVLTPGFFATVSPLAVQDLIGFGVGGAGSRSDAVSASFDVQYEINPASPQIPEARIEGVTHAVVTPSPLAALRTGTQGVGIFSGRAAVIHLGHGTNLIVRPRAAMVMDGGEVGGQFAGGGPGALFAVLRQILADSRALAANPAAFDEGRTRAMLLSRNDLGRPGATAAPRRGQSGGRYSKPACLRTGAEFAHCDHGRRGSLDGRERTGRRANSGDHRCRGQ